MTIAIYIDSCAWNYLHDRAIDLATELPSDIYTLHLTREVEIELEAIPNGGKKEALKAYIFASIERCSIKTASVFGFQTLESDGLPSKAQVYGGFGQGTFQSDADRKFYALPEVKCQLRGKSSRKTGLSNNQADASLAARSFGAFVLTNDEKPGPLKLAANKGGKIVYLAEEVDKSGLTLGEYMSRLRQSIE
ncbi:hypothetical protein [Xanthomonas citri]|uniref:hypothetical protein n=1 Tax=Xanthomonas citri TaxID=346 RepID=UPI000B5C8862|nr:hypothetical protein [Xanthomonas citri]ASK99062.1 hypothetical protein XcvCFBP7113P_00180 [Xanthomonas citri pv. vignicola]